MKDIFLLAHFLGLIIGAGTGFAVFAIGYLAPGFPAEARREVLIKLFPLRYISYIGLVLLIASGVVLSIPMGAGLMHQSVFVVKLVFVAMIAAASIFGIVQMRRVRSGADNSVFKLLGYAGKTSFASSVIVVTCAVYTFH
jgi:hypothetical protein